jgi:hypothetical protein
VISEVSNEMLKRSTPNVDTPIRATMACDAAGQPAARAHAAISAADRLGPTALREAVYFN